MSIRVPEGREAHMSESSPAWSDVHGESRQTGEVPMRTGSLNPLVSLLSFLL